jgi:hypothetical protein
MEIAVEQEDTSCGGSLAGRKEILEGMRMGILMSASLFLKSAELEPTVTESSGTVSMGRNSTFQVGRLNFFELISCHIAPGAPSLSLNAHLPPSETRGSPADCPASRHVHRLQGFEPPPVGILD